jgi:hypothetical protein
MIPVGVGENKIYGVYIFFSELVAKPADSGTGIHRNDVTAFGTDFQTGGIAAVFQIRFARNRNRASGSPACDFHLEPFNGNFFLK